MTVTYSLIYLVGFVFSQHSARPKAGNAVIGNGIDDVLKGLVEWLCAQVSSSSSFLFLSFLFVFFLVKVGLALVFKC